MVDIQEDVQYDHQDVHQEDVQYDPQNECQEVVLYDHQDMKGMKGTH